MWSIAELKSRGKQAFRANYWQSVAVSFVMAIFAGGTASAASNRVQSTTSEVTVEGAGVSPEQAAFLAAVVLKELSHLFLQPLDIIQRTLQFLHCFDAFVQNGFHFVDSINLALLHIHQTS